MPHLESLALQACNITDTGIAHFVSHPLTSLRFDRCPQISDAALQYVSRCPNLKHLGLVDTNVSNDAVDFLKSLKNLETLDLTGAKITAQGVETIKAALPDCKVVWEE